MSPPKTTPEEARQPRRSGRVKNNTPLPTLRKPRKIRQRREAQAQEAEAQQLQAKQPTQEPNDATAKKNHGVTRDVRVRINRLRIAHTYLEGIKVSGQIRLSRKDIIRILGGRILMPKTTSPGNPASTGDTSETKNRTACRPVPCNHATLSDDCGICEYFHIDYRK